jgi:hypothetical protein
MFAVLKWASGVQQLVEITPLSATDPGFGQGRPPVDPGYGGGHPWPDRPDQGLPGHGHPGNSLPIAPVRPDAPVIIPPNITWPPQLPPGIDNSLPPGSARPDQPIHIPPDPSIGINQPIYLPQLPVGTALLIALTGGNLPLPKGVPPGHAPAILYQGAGTKPVLVYVSAAASPK